MFFKVNVEKDLVYNIRSFQWISVWVDSESTLLHLIYKKTWQTIQFSTIILQFIYLIQTKDFNDFILPLAILIANSNGFFRYNTFNLPKTLEMLKHFDNSLCTAKNPAEKDILQNAVIITRFMSIAWIGAGLILWLTMTITAFINQTFVAPINFPESPKYLFWIMFVINAIAILYSTMTNITFDLFVPVIETHVGAQCDMLCNRLENLKCGKDDAHSKLIDCINHYRIIKIWSQQINDVYHLIILSQFVGSFMFFCLFLYTLSFTPFGQDYIMQLVCMVCAINELGITCWFGNEIYHKSDKISVAAYNCDWYNGKITFQKDLWFFMCCSKQSITLCFGKFFIATMPFFVQVMKASWSFYVMLVTVKE